MSGSPVRDPDDPVDSVVRRFFGGDPAAKALLVASADPSATPEERERADSQLVALERERLRCQRGEAPPDADAWEDDIALRSLDVGVRDKGPAPHRTRFRPAADVMRDRPAESVLEGLLYRGQTTVLVAESGAGKSFVVASIAGALVDPAVSAWAGRELITGTAALVLYERDAVALRLRALQEQGHDLADMHVLFASDPLSPTVARDGLEIPSPGELALVQDLAALRAKLEASGRPPLVLVAVDTIRASLAGAEESSRDVSAYLRAVGRIAHEGAPGAAVLLVHHLGWQDGDQPRKRERGSSALRGNVDVTLLLEADGEPADSGEVPLVLRTLKVRDEDRGAPIRLVRRRVVLTGFDDRGRLQTSCVIEPDRRTPGDVEAEEKAAADAQHQADNLAVLAIMATCPEATSIERLRVRAAIGKPRAAAAVGRILAAGWAREGARGCPFEVLPAGLEALQTQRDRRGPKGTGDSFGPAGPRRGPGTLPIGESRSSVLFADGPGTPTNGEGDRP